jgi:6-phosphogluconate dehydrogenase
VKNEERGMENTKSEIGMVGLGVMGRNLVLNMADHGFAVSGYDKDPGKVQLLCSEAGSNKVVGANNLEDFMSTLRPPRVVMMLVPAGPPVDAVIRDVLPYLKAGDLIIDGGNSHFKDTDLRQKMLAEKEIQFLGVGISGGEYGARHGPSLMPGGPKESYSRIRPVFEAVAARAEGAPCVAYLGPGSAGHYVKMVHNGIEYGLMQLIAETYDLLKRGLGLSDDEIHEVYQEWNRSELNAYLLEITANIFCEEDGKTGKRLVDVILDEATQKGTGRWTSQDAMDLQVPAPTIDTAVAMRNLTILKDERLAASQLLGRPGALFQGKPESFIGHLKGALYAAMIITFAQGLADLGAASKAYAYTLDLESVASIWRGGCIIRAGLLKDIRAAFQKQPDLANLLLNHDLGKRVLERRSDLLEAIKSAAELGIPSPGLMACLAYFDGYRSAWLPANLIQAQRDYFGAHTYERIDTKGVFHTQWEES